jgi:diacylglycerol kinase family enzyme
MLIILNPAAGGGRATERWEAFSRAFRRTDAESADIVLTGGPGLTEVVAEALSRGERRFVAAGGDGTVNSLLNALMRHREGPGLGGVALGAIGLGSSNDFHKSSGDRLRRPPARIDFGRVHRQDVGCIDALVDDLPIRRYFIVNASVGVTAEGNELFNRSSGAIAELKGVSAGAAIPVAALWAIARHSNLRAEVSVDGGEGRPVLLSNLAVLKNASISGPMRVSAGVTVDDGQFGIWLEEGLSRLRLLLLFISLFTGRFTPGRGSTVRRCASVRVRGPVPFPVEFDGEILHARDVTFTVLHNAIGVCQ